MRYILSHLYVAISLLLFVVIMLWLGTTQSFAQDETPELLELEGGIPAGFMVIEGDIIVPESFFEQNGESSRGGFGDTQFWPNGAVPFRFDTTGNDAVSQANQNAMQSAMGDLEAVANVTFVPRTSQTNFITIRNSTNDMCGSPPEPCPRNSSAVGMVGGDQIVNIVSWNTNFVMVHELMHALGFWHEQSRPDRDHYIEINPDNIDPDNLHNFQIRSAVDVYPKRDYGLSDADTYDFDSVMHYGQCAFAVSACPPNTTITVSPPNQAWQNQIGQRVRLSDLDSLTVSLLYRQPNWRFVDRTNTGSQNGSFSDPYRIFSDGTTHTPTGGTLFIQPGNYYAVGTYNKELILDAPLGNVVLGN
ncbi:MAG: M12 family metallopeptidase [Anaerolineales bacterium]|nr:M12 family metallopeptidase [Anaerolineales bacterium]